MTDTQAVTQSPRSPLARIKAMGHRLIHSKHMLLGVGVASVLEALIVPIPLEALIIPLMQARRRQIFAISLVALLGCLLGALIGYAVGYFVFDAIGMQLVSLVSTAEEYETIRQKMHTGGFWFVFTVGVVPIPFQVAMLAAGATQYSLGLFLLASALSRALRYFGLGVLVWLLGNRAQEVFHKHKLAVSLILLVVFAAIWAYSIWG